MPIKYGLGNPYPVKVVGMAHGILFIAYVILLIQCALEYDWPMKKSALAFVASLLPFGPFIFDKRLERDATDNTMANASIEE